MELKPGYQKTELGFFPNDWLETTVRSFDPFVTSGSRGWARYYASYGDLFVRITNMSRTSISLDLNDCRFVRLPLSENEGSRTQLRVGDILISITADIGIVSFIDSLVPFPAYINQHISLIRFSHENITPKFIAYFLAHGPSQRRFRAITDQGAKAGINLEAVRDISLVLPPTQFEQDAIATALSDTDALLDGLDRLIAKKRDLKQAAMQQLLTGETRLPGFEGEWESKRLGNMGVFLKGSGVRKDEAQSGDLPCIRYGEIYTHHNDYVLSYNSWISPAVASTAVRLKKGDILFAGSGETKDEIGKCVAFIDDCEAYAGGDIVILRPHEADTIFMGYYCNTASVRKQKASRGQGDAVVHISAAALSSVEVQVPPIPEQTAIATVLSDMDAEIAALEQRRNKIKDLKQAMMQELLTGRIRLIRSCESVAQEVSKSTDAKPHSWAFNEAVVISTLAKHFGKEDFPLGRKRYTKLSYLLHRHAERQAEGYLKKAAGPYNPKTKYGGPERIALGNGYIREHKNGRFSGFVAADNIAQAEAYFEKWYGQDAVRWLNQFRFKTNDDLEVLATVDMAAEELRISGKVVDVASVKEVIRSHPEWKAKLDRAAFSDTNIASGIKQSHIFFNSDNAGCPDA